MCAQVCVNVKTKIGLRHLSSQVFVYLVQHVLLNLMEGTENRSFLFKTWENRGGRLWFLLVILQTDTRTRAEIPFS